MANNAVQNIRVTRVTDASTEDVLDAIAIEEPLEIRLEYGAAGERKVQNISVTMRTPGNDAELATGFLFTEGIIKNISAIQTAEHCFIACAENRENVIQVSLSESITPNLQNTERNFYTTSSCGVCGKGSINAIRTVSNYTDVQLDSNFISTDILTDLPDKLRQHQKVFADTGGLHASALFTPQGELLSVREDVGRHNALDKLIGAAIKQYSLPLNNTILLLSGRASFELVQKAAMAGINIIAAVGAPSSLAVQLAQEFNITLAGFLRGQRFNIYTAPQRILISSYENSDQK
ncbi:MULTISPECIES: formate dehydrogenase accessory sulfurtransferase FdhD [unclassified Mucilaginibacter]|uniref:formate dehydrogenase accessory sulfurtransferase FdhD n=1 Tax=unclassified Mucilaginibacter TaxID=2617802 RepID=UPI002AC9E4AD|nr:MULTISPECIES: formate dehydrogenase accessory sulfurtransferase FdhD [unclassified Mucilaginibacter]MEB0262696.1 formate dehydrogenase accessory sulfurtransferase FdhD [Mucilaginibacter sp. 10I4]MEB0279466.1 formate dehydrogenase accessory sulfurtransferase FdhD [Mucilaginibacter sp. 10B2]MEB0300027.1 formate dehydrogenase accessory sulfurtransferase FdhD [Mucilaginibacter sp. 5C4]WPX21840.1 formate dehydrogenase accessory sulfurtransferase FdhD [Mucilaginibacter sp. 5C4]